MARRKNRESEQYGLSFLDCICCGFGAILLIFVLTTGKRANESKGQVDNAQEIIERLASDIDREKDEAARLRRSIDERSDRIAVVTRQTTSLEDQIIDQTETLSLLLEMSSTVEDELRRLMEDAENIPTIDEMPPLPLPNPEKRQYLTNFRMEGERLLFLVEASGGMLDTTIVGAIERSRGSAEDRRNAPKWKQTRDMLKWFIGNISPSSRYQIAFFNRDVTPVLEASSLDEWMDPLDTDNTEKVLAAIEAFSPSGGANLERAFQRVNEIPELPDNIVLILDGLPTLADSVPAGEIVDERIRIQMFLAARRTQPPNVPLNILLLPFEGDPTAAIAYWSVANYSEGSLVSPSRTWPNLRDRSFLDLDREERRAREEDAGSTSFFPGTAFVTPGQRNPEPLRFP